MANFKDRRKEITHILRLGPLLLGEDGLLDTLLEGDLVTELPPVELLLGNPPQGLLCLGALLRDQVIEPQPCRSHPHPRPNPHPNPHPHPHPGVQRMILYHEEEEEEEEEERRQFGG